MTSPNWSKYGARGLVIFPLTVVCLLLWSLLGLLITIPPFILAEIAFIHAFVQKSVSGRAIGNEKKQAAHALRRYTRGFAIIRNAPRQRPASLVQVSAVPTDIVSDWEYWNEIRELIGPLSRRLLSAGVVWAIAGAIYFFLNGTVILSTPASYTHHKSTMHVHPTALVHRPSKIAVATPPKTGSTRVSDTICRVADQVMHAEGMLVSPSGDELSASFSSSTGTQVEGTPGRFTCLSDATDLNYVALVDTACSDNLTPLCVGIAQIRGPDGTVIYPRSSTQP
jgi:hypothetical protein